MHQYITRVFKTIFLFFIYTFFIICVKWANDSVNSGWREYYFHHSRFNILYFTFMIKKNALIFDKDTQNYFSLSFIFTFFLICVKCSTGTVKLRRREYEIVVQIWFFGPHIWLHNHYMCEVFSAKFCEKWYLNIHFGTTFSLIFTLLFTLYLNCFSFHVNTYFFFVNYGCLVSCQSNGCSNNTPRFVKLDVSVEA